MRLTRKRRRRILLLALSLPSLLAAGWVAAWLAFSGVVERRLEALLERRFAADVSFGSLSYLPPFWVVASDGVLASDHGGERIEWIRAPSLRARPDRIPGTGRLAIEKLILVEPRLAVVRDERGMHHAAQLWRRAERKRRGSLPLRRIRASDVSVEYRILGSTSRAAEPLVVSGLDLWLDAGIERERTYDFVLDGGRDALRVASRGLLEVDDRAIRVDALDASLRSSSPNGGEGERLLPIRVRGAAGRVDLPKRRWRVDRARVSFGREERVVLDDVRATATVATGSVDVPDLAVRAFGGELRSRIVVDLGAPARSASWRGALDATDLELERLATAFARRRAGGVTGEMSGRAELAGRVAPGDFLASLRGSGELRASGGRFYEIPLVAELLDAIQVGKQAATVSSASAELRLEDRVVHVDNAALGSPTIGMQGHGEVGFDGRVDADLIIVPLGDLEAKLAASDVPVIGDAIAAIAGALEKILVGASELVYEFRVTGTLAEPEVTPVPVPVLTRSAATIFGRMVRRGWDGDVLSDDESG